MAIAELEGLNIPKHIAIILDGNRRYAKKIGLPAVEGHRKGAENFEKLLKWLKEIGIKEITAYTFSLKNFERSKEEKIFIFKLFKEVFKKFGDSKEVHENKVKIDFLGRIEMFPQDIQDMVKKIKEKTKDYNNYKVNFCFGYAGRSEITDACKKIAKQIKEGKINPKDINEEIVNNNMYFQDEPDIIIRTSGEIRTSDFLPWQGYYSEWFFIKEFWPEFSKEKLIEIIKEFNQRERRFGK